MSWTPEEAEQELGRTGLLVSEIVEQRAVGDTDPLHGNSDDDLLAAVEEFEQAVDAWRGSR